LGKTIFTFYGEFMKKIVRLSILLTLIACSTVAITGRKQITIIPDSQLLPMSFNSYKQVLSESKLSDDKSKIAMVKQVGLRIKDAVESYLISKNLKSSLDGYQWEFNLIESNELNAWCMPGGKVAFYTGILDVCQDEKGIAVVMGHEIAHAIADHGNERMSHGLIQNFGAMALNKMLEEKPKEAQALYMSAFGLGSTLLGVLPYSRLHESEADEMGLIFMAMAGYNPEEAVNFWSRMNERSAGQRPPEFLSTHPAPETRIADLKKLMPKAKKYYNKSSKKN
jgi:predicted Zn-dependent protease